MAFNLLSLLGISLAAMFFGYFFGLFEGRGQGYKKRKAEEPVEKISNKPAQIPPPSPAVESGSERSLLKLSLDARERHRLDLDGKTVDTSLLTAEQRKRLISLMLVMRPWVEVASAANARARPLAVAPAQTAFSQPRSSPVLNPIIQPPVPEVAPTTMVGQIDAILQSRLIGTPLANKGIRLVESSEGGVVVLVGLNRFAGVGDVTDPDVQKAIRAAIAEWEDKYTPG